MTVCPIRAHSLVRRGEIEESEFVTCGILAGMAPFEEVYGIVERIPRGRVATYGQVSRLLDGKYSALFVGWALHAIPEGRGDIPWHRVLNAKGGISTRQILGYAPDIQKL